MDPTPDDAGGGNDTGLFGGMEDGDGGGENVLAVVTLLVALASEEGNGTSIAE